MGARIRNSTSALVTGSDWTLASVGPARLVRCNSEDAGVGQTTGHWVALRPDAGRVLPVSADVR